MEYTVEFNVRTFSFWSGAYDRVSSATSDQLDELEARIEDYFYGCNPSETEINDFVWFECDDIFDDEDDEDDEDEPITR